MDEGKKSFGEWGRLITGDLLRRWPRDEDGELEPPVYLCHCTGLDMDDRLLISGMESYGIPCLKQYPGDGDFGKIILGMSGTGVDILVPAGVWADACELLRAPEELSEEE